MTTVHPRSASEPCSTSAPFAWSTFLMGDSLPFSASRLRIFIALVSTLKIDGRLTFSAVRASHLRPGGHLVTADAEQTMGTDPSYLPAAPACRDRKSTRLNSSHSQIS